ncbi:MAG: ATP-binding protein [Candidatus Margulisiibacteriota bacterium]
MLTTITTINIFAEILTAGVCFTMWFVFNSRHGQTREKSDLILSFIFLMFGLFVVGMTSSRLISNYGPNESLLLFIQRFTTSMLALGSIFVIAFVAIKQPPNMRKYFYPFIFASFIAACACYLLPMRAAMENGMLNPAVLSGPLFVAVIGLWDLSWAIFAVYSLIVLLKTDDEKVKRLNLMAFWSAFIMVASFVPAIIFLFTGYETTLLILWIVLFISLSGLSISSIILPDDDIALTPLSFVRSSILLKMVSMLVILIIITVEMTALVTNAISKRAITKELIESDRRIVFSIKQMTKIYSGQTNSLKELKDSMQAFLSDIGEKQGRKVYIIDPAGKIVVFSDPKKPNIEYYLISERATQIEDNISGGEFMVKNVGKMVGAFGPANIHGWQIVVARPIEVAYSDIRKMETNTLIVFIVGVMIAVIVGGFFSKNIEDRIRSIVAVTEAVRKGNFNYSIPVNSIDEIGHLAKEFNMMTAELKESQDHLIASEKLAALGTMAAGMAHEIKNPLVALRTFTQLLPLKWEDKEFREKFISIIPPEIDKINKIAENLLKFGRPSKPEFKPINVETVLDEVLDLVDNQIKKNNIRVSTKFVKTPKIYGDPSQLSQAFLNIIMNAIQAIKEGGELIIKTDIGHVIQLGKITRGVFLNSPRREDNTPGQKIPMVFVEITDSGPGISEENMKNMFDPFFTTKESGTGMGLPITLRIIEDHKGSIKLRSQLGKGTTFIIMLPPTEQIEEAQKGSEG